MHNYIKVILVCLLMSFVNNSFAQTSAPYYNGFEGDVSDWKTKIYYGQVNEWQVGQGNNAFAKPHLGYKAWGTKLSGSPSYGSSYLQSPTFDISDTTVSYVLSFYVKSDIIKNGSNRAHIDYSLDEGVTWIRLDITGGKSQNWSSDLNSTNSVYQYREASLNEFMGESTIAFRFFCGVNSDVYNGIMIDDFSLSAEGDFDVIAKVGSADDGNAYNKPEFRGKAVFGKNRKYQKIYGHAIFYYSSDAILDAGDIQIDSINLNHQSTSDTKINITVSNDGNMQPGKNYIFYKFFPKDSLDIDLSNNTSYFIIDADYAYPLPFVDDFETSNPDYHNSNTNPECIGKWNRKYGDVYQLGGAHSGKNAMFLDENPSIGSSCVTNLDFPIMDLKQSSVINYFFRSNVSDVIKIYRIQFSGPYKTLKNWWQIGAGSKINGKEKWNHQNIKIEPDGEPLMLRFSSQSSHVADQISSSSFDDLYVGPSKPDLHISNDDLLRSTGTGVTNEILNFRVHNWGSENSGTFEYEVYWSTDSIIDGADVLLGKTPGPDIAQDSSAYLSFPYLKQSNASEYYLIVKVDPTNAIDEMRENNTLALKHYTTSIQSTPFLEDFETVTTDWYHNSDYLSDPSIWQTALDQNHGITGKAIGVDVRVKNPTNTKSYWYSPIFDIDNLSSPILTFDLLNKTKYSNPYSHLIMSYTTDGGGTWQVLDTTNQSFKKWYYIYDYSDYGGMDNLKNHTYGYLNGMYMQSRNGFPYNGSYLGRADDGYEDASIDISSLKGNGNVQFRFEYLVFNFNSDQTRFYVDNFKIEDGNIDLEIASNKDLWISDNSKTLRFGFYVKNNGKLISAQSHYSIYLSTDPTISGDDYKIVSDSILYEVRPGQRAHHLVNDTAYTNMIGKKFMIIQLDSQNEINEQNESNNISVHALKSEGISTYPYEETFTDQYIEGWKIYNTYKGKKTWFRQRFTHEVFYDVNILWQHYLYHGKMNLDPSNPISNNNHPTVYAESPVFDFSSQTDVYISFDFSFMMSSNAGDVDGAKLEYSLDGGNVWLSVGVKNDPNGTNWYNADNMVEFGDGWAICSPSFKTAIYNATSLLSGKSHVTFRFRTKTNDNCSWYGKGFKFDNFKVGPTKPVIDFEAINIGDTLVLDRGAFPLSGDSIPMKISNIGNINGATHLTMKWSKNTDFNLPGITAFEYTHLPDIPAGGFGDDIIKIPYPAVCDSMLYLVYEINSVNSNNERDSSETNFSNNIGYFVVKLTDKNVEYPNQNLTFSNDTILCNGDSIKLGTLHPEYTYKNLWNTSETTSEITITTAGSYFVDQKTSFNCVLRSDTINVTLSTPQVNILTAPDTVFCYGDSIKLEAVGTGNYSWSNGETTKAIYVDVGAEYSVELVNTDHCSISDTVHVNQDFSQGFVLSKTEDQHECNGPVYFEVENEVDGFAWSTGDTIPRIFIDNDQSIFATSTNSCGTFYSDTLKFNFYNLLDSISPNTDTILCMGDTIEFKIHSSSSTQLYWTTTRHEPATAYEITNFKENVIDATGYHFGNYQWHIYGNPVTLANSIWYNSNDLYINDLSGTIELVSDYLRFDYLGEIRAAFSIHNTQPGSSVKCYYETGDGIWIPFETNPVINYNENVSALTLINNVFLVKVKIVFEGSGLAGSHKLSLNGVNQATGLSPSYVSEPTSIYSHSFNSFNTYSGHKTMAVAENSFCKSFKEVYIDYTKVDKLLSLNEWFCPGDTVVVNKNDELQNHADYKLEWLDSIGTVYSDSILMTCYLDSNFSVYAKVTNEDGCVGIQTTSYIYKNYTEPNLSVSNSGLILYTQQSYNFEYSWLNCDKDSLPIIGEDQYSFTPDSVGNYAVVIVDEDGCVDTSTCEFLYKVSTEELDARLRLDDISILPNPTINKFSLKVENLDFKHLETYSNDGQLMLKSDNYSDIDCSSWAQGSYYVKVFSNQGLTKVLKLLILR